MGRPPLSILTNDPIPPPSGQPTGGQDLLAMHNLGAISEKVFQGSIQAGQYNQIPFAVEFRSGPELNLAPIASNHPRGQTPAAIDMSTLRRAFPLKRGPHVSLTELEKGAPLQNAFSGDTKAGQ